MPTKAVTGTADRVPWWSASWLVALEAVTDPRCWSQGRWHLRSGRVVRCELSSTGIQARLEGGQATPRSVTIRLRAFSSAQWAQIAKALASNALWHVQLLAGVLPEEFAAVCGQAGAPLLPRLDAGSALSVGGSWGRPRVVRLQLGDAAVACTCSALREGVCKHVAAVWQAASQQIAANPLLLLALRGWSREELLAEVRRQRAILLGTPPAASDAGEPTSASTRPASAESNDEGRRVHPTPPLPVELLPWSARDIAAEIQELRQRIARFVAELD